MPRLVTVGLLLTVPVACSDESAQPALEGRVVATGLPHAGAVTAVGTFLPGGPINDNPAFRAFTEPGRALHADRVLVGTRSNLTALRGRVQLLSAQSPAFLNCVTSPQAVTAGQPGVSNMLDISINNAFGRLWPANAPRGLDQPGSSTILDPGGMPLAGAPNAQSGGVFFGTMTNRQPVPVVDGGLEAGAVAPPSWAGASTTRAGRCSPW